ncbi:efflux RND transporter periplasmic adaptor subunit [Isoalcanivorax indicus]|uniref:efflux RND transporter periplasmic adaptor subunit n=1 Tax=Isoalcanivorax indicus TaxID=2202653 RepID=UPI000DB90E91|nr:efflux RND transporter periplasmic adaptor subunit [Isoalcanivorax indicus]
MQRVRVHTGAALALSSLLLVACGSADNGQGGQPPPPTVMVVEARSTSVDVERDYAGRARGAREVQVRARVEGILERRRFTEGQVVEAGEVLFEIDPQPFEIALKRAEAERQDARASLNQAEREWRRINRLFEQNAVSERERDQALSQRELAQARLALTEASVADAQRNLGYAEVKAPLAGVTGLELLPEGSLVAPGDLLVTVTERDPMHVRFALPERDAALQRQGNGDHARRATLILPGGDEYERTGEVNFTDSTIDARTGSVMARAVFPNPDGVMVPGQFVRVRVALHSLDEVVLVPETAIGQGREGVQVFVVREGQASATPVAVGPVIRGQQVVLSGLEAGDLVVVNGQVMLQDGMPVETQKVDTETALDEARRSAVDAEPDDADDNGED